MKENADAHISLANFMFPGRRLLWWGRYLPRAKLNVGIGHRDTEWEEILEGSGVESSRVISHPMFTWKPYFSICTVHALH